MQRLTLRAALLVTALAFAVPALGQTGSSAPAPSADRVDLNTATSAQLEALPGIGPATAARIIEHRDRHGRFAKVEELMNVRGIGEKSFLQLRPLVVVTPAGDTASERPGR